MPPDTFQRSIAAAGQEGIGWPGRLVEVPGEVLLGQGYGFIFMDHERQALVSLTFNYISR